MLNGQKGEEPLPSEGSQPPPRLRFRLFKGGGDTAGSVFGEEILLLHPSSCLIQGPDSTLEICRNSQVTRELELDLSEVERLPGHSQAVGGLLIGWKKGHPGSLPPVPPGSWWPSLQGPSAALLLPRILFENSETHFSSSALV